MRGINMLPFPIISNTNIIPYQPSSQVLITTTGNTTFTVPSDVTKICVCVISPGQNNGGGGGLSYRNDIPVTPGEVLNITIQAVNPAAYAESGIYRGTEKLCVSTSGSATLGGRGGKTADPINDGGGNGGNGYISGGSRTGGGAGGYTGNGGNANSNATSATDGTGGAGGGGCFTSSPFNMSGTGGGTGIIKAGTSGTHGINGSPNGRAGSSGSGKNYGGGGAYWDTQTAPGIGGIRIIWGNLRSYPDNSEDK